MASEGRSEGEPRPPPAAVADATGPGGPRPHAREPDATRDAREAEATLDACEPDATADAEVVTRVLAGEGRAYGELVERYQRRLYWSCLRLLGDPDEADDAVQEAFVRAYANLPQYDSRYRFYTWIFRIARNLCLNQLRRRRLWGLLPLPRAREGLAREAAAGSARPAEREPESRDDAGSGVEERELAEALASCLEALPREQRECFELRHADEMSYAEIATVLGVPQGTVMSRLSRARERMRECLRSKGVAPG